jgi:phospholipase C
MHETSDVLSQLTNHNSGFVLDYAIHYPNSSPSDRAEIMKYHDLDTLPALHTLARNFTVCDHWFSSVPGPTWTNRLFAMSGTSLGRIKMSNGIFDQHLHWYDQPTLFDRLNEKGVSWSVYFGDVPLSLLLVHQWEPSNAAKHRAMTEFFKDAAGDPDKFPNFCWIEPSYLQPGANDDHPPHDVLAGEVLIAQVYNALRHNEELWKSTLLVVLFDEHGGLYDHAEPPTAAPPDSHQEEYSFDRLGVRVPCVLCSPWLPAGVLPTQFDHTSFLKFLTERWNLGFLGNRTAAANSFSSHILSNARDLSSMPQQILGVPASLAVSTPRAPSSLNDHQLGLFALSHLLETMSGEDPGIIVARSRQVLSGLQSQMDVTMDRFEGFLKSLTPRI